MCCFICRILRRAGFVAQKALDALLGPLSAKSLKQLCSCQVIVGVEKPAVDESTEDPDLSAPAAKSIDSTHEGFMAIAQAWDFKFETGASSSIETGSILESELPTPHMDGEDIC
jgi:hypothetical protein